MFSDYLAAVKPKIQKELKNFLTSEKKTGNDRMYQDALDKLIDYASNGKMIRGSLVFLGSDTGSTNKSPDLIKIAAAMELFHAGLLIHDDIMDSAETRRGQQSIHSYYTAIMQKNHSRYPKNTGKSLAMCVGDAAFFLGYNMLLTCQNHEHAHTIMRLVSEELQTVTAAQMQDIVLGSNVQPVRNLDEILSVYKTKTGRYTLYLPLASGALIGKLPQSSLSHLERFATHLGIVYQLVDDYLDIFGNEKVTGKPQGTDIREGKQTPYIFFLRQIGDQSIQKRIDALFSKGDVTTDDITWVKQMITRWNIDTKIHDLISMHTKRAKESLERIPMEEHIARIYDSFVQYLVKRLQ